MLKGRTVLVGVSGGIAAYKSLELVRGFRRLEAEVYVIMTRAATSFITPLSFQTLSGNPVYVDMFAEPKKWAVEHVALADRADLLVVAPATANVIGKMANGIADDYLTTIFTAVDCPVLIIPSMNSRMYTNSIVQHNVEKLRRFGYRVMEPARGKLASGAEGVGRMPEPEDVLREAIGLIIASTDMAGLKVVVTAGPTREHIDPVRYISNPSSGRMGYALAEAARARGAEVALISGPTHLAPPRDVRVVEVQTAKEMRDAVLAEVVDADVLIKAAAVSDYRPRERAAHKIKKEADELRLELVRNPDILLEVGRNKGRLVLVGFAAETDRPVENGLKKLKAKNLDMIVVNDVTQPGVGFGSDDNRVILVTRDGNSEELPLLSKTQVAQRILDKLISLLARGPQPV